MMEKLIILTLAGILTGQCEAQSTPAVEAFKLYQDCMTSNVRDTKHLLQLNDSRNILAGLDETCIEFTDTQLPLVLKRDDIVLTQEDMVGFDKRRVDLLKYLYREVHSIKEQKR